MAFPIIPRVRSGASGYPTSLYVGELAVNTKDGELYLGADNGVVKLAVPGAAGTTATQFTGNGSATDFAPILGWTSTSAAAYLVSVGGIDQRAGVDYTIGSANGGTLQLATAPANGVPIQVRAITQGTGGGGSSNATQLQGVDISGSMPATGDFLEYDGTQWIPTAVTLGNATKIQGRDVSNATPDANMALSWVNNNWQPSFPQNADAVSLQSQPIANTTPTSGQVLTYDGTQWAPGSTSGGDAGKIWSSTITYSTGDVVSYSGVLYYSLSDSNLNHIPQVGGGFWNIAKASPTGTAGGDLTGGFPSPTLAAITIAQTNIGSATVVPVLSIDAKGRVTSLTTAAIQATSTTAITSLSGDVVASGPGAATAALTTTGIAPGTYGSSTVVPAFTVDAKGRATAVTTYAINALTTAQIAGLATTTPAALSVSPVAGVSTFAARADHAHLLPSAADVGALGATAAAGGDLAGNFPNPTLKAITSAQTSVGSATVVPVISVDTAGRVTALTTASIQAGSTSALTALTGDVVASGPGSAVASLTTTGIAPGTYGSATVVPAFTVDAKGRATAVTTYAINALTTAQIAGLTTSAPAALTSSPTAGLSTYAARADHAHQMPSAADVGALGATATAGGDLAGNFPNPTLKVITTAQTVGSSSVVPVITVDAAGRVTSLTTAGISATSTTGITALTGDVIASGNGSVSAALTTTGMAAVGTYGSSTAIPAITTDGKGRITAITTNAFNALTTAQIAGLATTSPATLATSAYVGLSTYAARADHQHAFPNALQVNAIPITGGSGTNTSLTTPTITTGTINSSTANGLTIAGFTENPASATIPSTYTINIATYTVWFLTLTSATPSTITMPTVGAGKSFTVYVFQPSTGTATTATFSGVKWSGGVAPTVTPTLGKVDVFSFISDGVNWYGSTLQNFTY